MFAIAACAVAIPAGVPQPRPIAPVAHQRAASPESEQLTSGADEQDLKASSSYGYGSVWLITFQKHTWKWQRKHFIRTNSLHRYYGGLGGYSGGLGGYYGGLGSYYGGSYGGYPYAYSSYGK